MSNIIDFFNNNYNNFIEVQPWMNENKLLSNFELNRLSIPVTTIEMKNDYNISYKDIENILVTTIKNEISSNFIKKINKGILNTNNFDYIDLRKGDINELVNLILSSGYKNLITNDNISSELKNSPLFNLIYQKNSKNSRINIVGNLGGITDIYYDPYISYNDDRILLFNQIEFNIDNMVAYENNSTFAPRVNIEYNFDYKVGDSKLIFIIRDENSETYREYIKLQRDYKIDNILNNG
jgi:hypothetical protein